MNLPLQFAMMAVWRHVSGKCAPEANSPLSATQTSSVFRSYPISQVRNVDWSEGYSQGCEGWLTCWIRVRVRARVRANLLDQDACHELVGIPDAPHKGARRHLRPNHRVAVVHVAVPPIIHLVVFEILELEAPQPHTIHKRCVQCRPIGTSTTVIVIVVAGRGGTDRVALSVSKKNSVATRRAKAVAEGSRVTFRVK